jgi:periplasmic divalent cation tolerance protein
MSYCVVLITAPAGTKSKQLAKSLLAARLAACVNVVPLVRSLYWWKGKLESAQESLLIVKTRRSLIKKLTKHVLKNHPYSVPEVIALPIMKGHKPYLDWIFNETKN